MDKEWMLNTNIFKQLIKQFKICSEIIFFLSQEFTAQLLIFASYKPDPVANITDALRSVV